MQVIKYFLCVRGIDEKSLNRCWIVIFAYLKKQSLEAFFKKRCYEKFRKFYKKTLVLESLFNKVADPRIYNFLKKRLQYRCFSGEISETLSKKVFLNLFFCIFTGNFIYNAWKRNS